MKPNIPRSWHSLPPAERRALEKFLQDQAYLLADREHEEVQETMIKFNCMMLHDHFDFTEEQLLQYVALWKRTYRRNDRHQSKGEQDAWLESEMKKCFPTCGFPQMRIDDLKSKERSIFDG